MMSIRVVRDLTYEHPIEIIVGTGYYGVFACGVGQGGSPLATFPQGAPVSPEIVKVACPGCGDVRIEVRP